MRVECKFYESRSYKSGDTVRACRLDLAPEAPWRCPENCPAYERKLVDSGWVHGSLANRPTPDEPHLDDDAIALLHAAEDVINVAGPGLVAEAQAERERARRAAAQASGHRRRRWWWPFGR